MSYDTEVLADSPVVYLRLDETSGSPTTFADSSGNGHDATNEAATGNVATLLTNGDTGKALSITGSADAVIAGFNWATGDWSFEAWINLTGSGISGYKTLVKQGGSGSQKVYLLIDPSDHLWRWGAADSGFVITRDTTHHVVYTFDQATGDETFYVDGVEVGTHNASGLTSNSSDIYIGQAAGDGHNFDGVMDEVALYSSVLSAARVTAHYNEGTGAGGGDTPISGTDTPSVAITESSSVDTGGGGTAAVHLSYHFPTDAEGWTGDSGGAWDSDGVDTGSLLSTLTGFGLTEEWTAPGSTWEDFGVPPGATVESIEVVTVSYRVTTGSPTTASYATPGIFFLAGSTYDYPFIPVGPPIDADSGWVTAGPEAAIPIDAPDQDSTTSVNLYADVAFLTESGTYALDAIEIDINYSGTVSATPVSASDTLTVGITDATSHLDSGELPATRVASAYIG